MPFLFWFPMIVVASLYEAASDDMSKLRRAWLGDASEENNATIRKVELQKPGRKPGFFISMASQRVNDTPTPLTMQTARQANAFAVPFGHIDAREAQRTAF